MNRYFWSVFAFVVIITLFGVNCDNKVNDKKKDYKISDNQIDDTPTPTSKVEQKPIQLIVRTIKGWARALPEAIIAFLSHLLAPFVGEVEARRKVDHFLKGLVQLIVKEMPKSYSEFLGQIPQFLDMFEMLG